MYKNAKLRADELLQAEWDVTDWFKKHATSEVSMKEINLFAIPYANAADCQVIVSRLVRVGAIKRIIRQDGIFAVAVSYTSVR